MLDIPDVKPMPLGFNGDLGLPPDVEFPLGIGLLVELAALGGGGDGVKNAAIGDARLDMLTDQLVPVASDPDSRILGLGRRLFYVGSSLFGSGFDVHRWIKMKIQVRQQRDFLRETAYRQEK